MIRKLFPALAIGAFLIGPAHADLIYGTPFISSGQGESGLAGIEFVPGGVCYADVFLGFPQHRICAAGIPSEPLITYNYPIPPWLREDKPPVFEPPPPGCVGPCAAPPPIDEPTSIPEPALMWAYVVVLAGILWMRKAGPVL